MTSNRHFEGEEFPSRCDHCPAELAAGVAYRRVQLVIDAGDSVVGAVRANVEHSFELVLCSACADRIEHWATHPLGVEALGELVDDLDDQALLDELEKEAFILGDGGGADSKQQTADSFGAGAGAGERIETDVTKWRNVSGVPIFELPERCSRHQGQDYDLVCFDCHQLLQARARCQEAAKQLSPAETVVREALREWTNVPKVEDFFRGDSPKPCLDPDKMNGAGDQFPGDDHHLLGKDDEPS